MSTSLITINQTGLPAGVAGVSRDDLAAYTGTNPIQLAQGGVGGTTFLWSIVDQPPGASASLSATNTSTTTLINATVPGSYKVQLTVDGGGSVGQIGSAICGIQIALPAWISPSDRARLRIPAFSETIEFNAQPSPDTGANTRGWAQEMDFFFRALAAYAFGVVVQSDGSGTVRANTLNFTGSGVSVSGPDPSTGLATVTISGGSGSGGIANLSNLSSNISGGPWTNISIQPANLPTSLGPNSANGQFAPGSGSTALLYLTSTEHQFQFHRGGIASLSPFQYGALAGTIDAVPSPMTWSFADLSVDPHSVNALTAGRYVTPSEITAAISYGPAAPSVSSLYDLYLDATTGNQVTRVLVASGATQSTNLLIVDMSATHPLGAFALTSTSGRVLSWAGGLPINVTGLNFSSGNGSVRLYHPNGVDWVQVASVGGFVTNSDTWTVATPTPNPIFLRLARAVNWVNSGVGTWGVNQGGTQIFVDGRQWGSVGLLDLQEQVKYRIDKTGADLHWDAGVVFYKRQPNEGPNTNSAHGSFALIAASSTHSPPTILSASGCEGGYVWCQGRRYFVENAIAFSAFSLPSQTVLVAAQITGPETAQLVVQAASDPISAITEALADPATPALEGPQFGLAVMVPLYFGTTDGSSNLLLDGRVDLRRDVAHSGQWTVGTRDYQIEAMNTLQPNASQRATQVLGDLAAEFESVGAALVWHAVLTGSDNISVAGGQIANAPLHLRVLRNTYESFPFNLWNNISITGEGQPTLLFPLRDDLSGFAQIGGTADTFTSVPYKQMVANVTLRGVDLVGTTVNSSGTGTQVLLITAPQWNPALYSSLIPLVSAQNIVLDGVGFGMLSQANLPGGEGFAALRMTCQTATGENTSGMYRGVILRNCRTGSQALATGSTPVSAFEIGFALSTHNASGGSNGEMLGGYWLIEKNRLEVQCQGVQFASADGDQKVWITDNFVGTSANGAGLAVSGVITSGSSNIEECYVERNTVFYSQFTAQSGQGGVVIGAPINRGSVSQNRVYVPDASYPNSPQTGLLFSGALRETAVRGNDVFGFATGMGFLSTLVNVAVQHNNLVFAQGSEGAPDPAGLGISLNGMTGLIAQNLTLSENTSLYARVSIVGKLLATSQNIRIANNHLRGIFTASSTAAGTYHARGIFLFVTPGTSYPLGLVITGNLIQNFCGVGTADPAKVFGTGAYPMAGIIVANTTDTETGFTSDVHVDGNTLISGVDVADNFANQTTPIMGIALYGAFVGSTVRQNSVANEKVYSTGINAGIFLDCGGYLGAANNLSGGGPLVQGNLVRWASGANVAAGNTGVGAGILLQGALTNLVVTQNHVTGQTVTPTSVGAYPGYFFGLLSQANSDGFNPTVCSITQNFFGVDTINPHENSAGPLAAGCGIWIRSGADNFDVSNNNVQGSWVHNPNGTSAASDSTEWGMISICVDAETTLAFVRVQDNFILAGGAPPGSSGLVGLIAGVHLGHHQFPNSGSTITGFLQVNGNVIQGALDSTLTGIESAGLLLDNKQQNGNVGPIGKCLVQGNYIEVSDFAASPELGGIRNNCFQHTHFFNNVALPISGSSNSTILDAAPTGTQKGNLWSNNVFGKAGSPGTSSLSTSTYQAQTSANNWSGSAFV